MILSVIVPSAVEGVHDSDTSFRLFFCSYWTFFVMWSKQKDGGLRYSAVRHGIDFQSFSTHTRLYILSVENIKELW